MKEFVHNGRKLLASRKFQEAVKVCRLGLLEHPNSVEGRMVLAQALMSLARYDEVLAETRVALETDGDSAPATVLMGEALFFKGMYAQARETLQRARELDPDNATVTRLLDELDATVEVAVEESGDAVGDTTRSYPEDLADADVGDQTEIQDLPPVMLEHPGAAPHPEPDRGPIADTVEPDDDQERPDPVAGEVDIPSADDPLASQPVVRLDIKVDVSKVDATPAAEEDAPEGEQQREGSHSGARRWAERKWLGPDEAVTREAVLVPSPKITTEEMRDSDLFGRNDAQKRALVGEQADDEPSSVGSPRAEDGTKETKLSRPEPSKSEPSSKGPPPAASPKDGADPWADEDEETRPLRPVTPSAAKRPEKDRSARGLAREAPPPPPPPPAAKSPFRLPPPGGPRATLPAPGGAPPPPGGPRPPAPGARPAPPVSGGGTLEFTGVNFEAPPAAPPAGDRPGGTLGFRPTVPAPKPPRPSSPPSSATRPAAPKARAAVDPWPAKPPPSLPEIEAPAPLPTQKPRPQAAPRPTLPRTPVAPARPTTPAPRSSAPARATPLSASTSRRAVATPQRQEHTAPAARRPRRPGFAGRWKLVAIVAGLAVILATIILIVVAQRKDQQSETVKRHHRKALAHLEKATFHSLKLADAELRRLLTESASDKVAKSLRAFTVSVLAVEHGEAADRAEQVLDRGGAKDDDLHASARILMALTRRDWATVARLGDQGTRRWPRSCYVAYARGIAALRQGRPAEGLRLLDSVPQSKAQSLILRNKIRALLALGQKKDADKLLETIPVKE